MPDNHLARKYSAFISYRHADNRLEGRRWAEWLHQAIETYEVPKDLIGTTNQRGQPVPESLFPVFRDEEELPADADLSSNIRRALENSDALIVLCSPQACESRFVHDEICYFKELGNSSRIISLLLEGEPNASDDPGKLAAGFSPEQECLPIALRVGVPGDGGTVVWDARAEPIAADVRPQGLTEQGWTSVAAYRAALMQEGRQTAKEIDALTEGYAQRLELAVLKIAAGLLGLPLGLLRDRDKARQLEKARLQASRLRRLVVIFGALTALAVGLGIAAWVQKNLADEKSAEALRQRSLADEQKKIAIAFGEEAQKKRLEAEEAQKNERQANEKRRLLLVEASRSDRLAGLAKLGTEKEKDAFAHFARAITYDPESTMAAEAAFLALNEWKSILPKTFIRLGMTKGYAHLSEARFTADGQGIFTYDGSVPALCDTNTGRQKILLQELTNESHAQLSDDGKLIITISRPGHDRMGRLQKNVVQMWDAASGRLLTTFDDAVTPERSSGPLPDQVATVRLSPDGRRLVLVSNTKVAQMWDATSGRWLATLGGNGEMEMGTNGLVKNIREVTSARFSPDSRRIVTGVSAAEQATLDPSTGNQATFHIAAKIWDAGDNKQFEPLATLVVPGAPTGQRASWTWSPQQSDSTEDRLDCQFSPDGQRFLCPEGKVVYVGEATTGRLLATLAGHSEDLTSARFSPDGRQILTASKDKTVRLWNAGSGELIRECEDHQDTVNSAEFSPDGKSCITASNDKTARVFGATERVLQGHSDRVIGARYSPDGTGIVTTSKDGTVGIWKSANAAFGKTFGRTEGNDSVVAFSPDGSRYLVIAPKSGSTGLEQTAQIFETGTGLLVTALQGFGDGSRKVADNFAQDAYSSIKMGPEFTSDGLRVLTMSGNVARVWYTVTGKLLTTCQANSAMGVHLSPDGRYLVTMSMEKNAAQVLDAATGRVLFSLPATGDSFVKCRFSPDGQQIALLAPTKISVYQAPGGKLHSVLNGEIKGGQFTDFCFGKDGKRIFSAKGNVVQTWATSSGKLLQTMAGHENLVNSVDVSPDDKLLVSASFDKSARVWNPETGGQVAVLRGHSEKVDQAQFNADGSRIITVSGDKTTRVWNSASGDLIGSLSVDSYSSTPGHLRKPDGPRISKNGEYIVGVSDRGIAQVFTLLPSTAIAPPDWFPQFLKYVGQRQFNSAGELENIRTEDWLALRGELLTKTGKSERPENSYELLLNRYLAAD